MGLIVHRDNWLIQMSLIDTEQEIETILREVIGGLEAWSLTKQNRQKLNAMSPQILELGHIAWDKTTTAQLCVRGYHRFQG